MRLRNCLNPVSIGKLEWILSIAKKYKKKTRHKLHNSSQKTKRHIITIKINSKLSLQFDCWFPPKTPSCHILTIHPFAKHYINLFSSSPENRKFFYGKTILYCVIRCEQMFLFTRLFSKKVDISKTRKRNNFKFSPLAKKSALTQKICSFNPGYFTTQKWKFVWKS